MISSGNWKFLYDTIYLHFSQKRFRIDSLKYSKKWKKYLIISDTAQKFKVKNSSLICLHKEKFKSYMEILYRK